MFVCVCARAHTQVCDLFEALTALEQPLALFPGFKLIDLAYEAGCLDFISVCCRPSIDRRFAGDLLETDQPYELPGGVSVVVDSNVAVLAALIFGLGLLSPVLLCFRAPPKVQFSLKPSTLSPKP